MKTYFLGAVFFVFAVMLSAQESSFSSSSDAGTFLIPQTMYVGDQGRLVLPLGAAYTEVEPVVITETHLLPSAADIVINRIEIEKRTGAARLLVDFQAYAPGLLELPPLHIGGNEFTGLTVQITSILEAEGDRTLSEAASPMPVPGTLVLVYGSIIGIVFFLLMVIFMYIWGVPYFKMLGTRRHRRFVLRSLQRSLNKVRNSAAKNGVSGNAMLMKLSQDFRNFLSFFTRINCFTMVPKEFLQLPNMKDPGSIKGGEVYIFEHAEIVYRIFRRCDELRFSGDVCETESVIQVLDTICRFVSAFESSEKESLRRKEPASPVQGAPS